MVSILISRIENVVECLIVRRINRFVVEVLVRGRRAKAHTNNTGRLSEYFAKNRKAYCIKKSSNRKTKYRLLAISENDLAAIIDTQIQMKAFEIAVNKGIIPWLRNCKIIKRNVKLGLSRIDYLLECSSNKVYVEIKSAVLRGDKHYAMYPDCPSLRGRKHIMDIINHVLSGGLGAIVFIAAIPHVKAFKPYEKGDPKISMLLRQAYKVGVVVKAISLHYNPSISAIFLDNPDLKVQIFNTNEL